MAQVTEAGMMTGTFEIEPQGPYSLEAAASFEFGPKQGTEERSVRLAFAVDGWGGTAGVLVRQDASGVIHGEVQGSRDLETVRAQVARILSLDADGTGWEEVGRRDPVMGALQARYHGFRPVLFHSPYEAAAWSVLYGRKTLAQVRRLRDRVASRYGDAYEIDGETMWAFPTPDRLLEVEPEQGLADVIVARLHAVARFALDGHLDSARLRAMDAAEALADLRRLPGVGEFFSGLILVRAAGRIDDWTHVDKLDACLRHYYGVDPGDEEAFQAVGDRLRPYRTWAAVTLRRSGYDDGVA